MKKVEVVKKLVLSVLVILYDIVSLFLCYVILSNLIFNLTLVSVGQNSIGIIGGAGIPTLIFKAGNVLKCGLAILFVLLSIVTVFLLTVSMFKKQTTGKLHILLCLFSALTLIVFMPIPVQAYSIFLYVLVEKISFFKYLKIIYSILSVATVVTNALLATRKRRMQT